MMFCFVYFRINTVEQAEAIANLFSSISSFIALKLQFLCDEVEEEAFINSRNEIEEPVYYDNKTKEFGILLNSLKLLFDSSIPLHQKYGHSDVVIPEGNEEEETFEGNHN